MVRCPAVLMCPERVNWNVIPCEQTDWMATRGCTLTCSTVTIAKFFLVASPPRESLSTLKCISIVSSTWYITQAAFHYSTKAGGVMFLFVLSFCLYVVLSVSRITVCDRLFNQILSNKAHVLNNLLPPTSVASQNSNLLIYASEDIT